MSELFEELDVECGAYETYTLARFLFLAASSVIAFLGTGGNLLLVFIFASRKYPNTPPTLFPTVLAILDTAICFLYILLFGVDAAVVYLHVKSLFLLYHSYIVPAFVLSRMTQLAIPYMLILATLERFVWIAGNMRNRLLKHMYSARGREITMLVTIVACCMLRAPLIWAITVNQYPNCTDFFRTQTAGPAEWAMASDYYRMFDFHLLSITQTVVPFFVLVVFNLIIVKRLTSGRNDNITRSISESSRLNEVVLTTSNNFNMKTMDPGRGSKLSVVSNCNELTRSPKTGMIRRRMSSPVRNAIFTMMAIVASYLISNSLHLVLTVLERSDFEGLKDPLDPNLASTFHTTFSDVVSFVYMATSAIRIVIYYLCNPIIRDDLNGLVGKLRCRCRRKRKVLKEPVML